ncbi:MAG: OFA family MFS transporter [Desulfobacterales bacterium]|nr:OFA family MFS transporter [Desulfobacterales bacterium]
MEKIKNKGWQVTLAGLGINLALGILYTWSIFRAEISESIKSGDGRFNWNIASLNDPYAVCCLVFAFTMISAGRLQDKVSPRITAIFGGILTGAGLLVISQSNILANWILGFGILMGMGLGFGYASATPPAIKWFPARKTGMIAGLVVAGFGLASVYIAPLSQYLIGKFGLSEAMMIFGVSFIVVVCGLAMFLVNPPEGYKPEDTEEDKAKVKASKKPAAPAKKPEEFPPSEVLKTKAFYKLWFMFCVGSGAGLIIIGSVAGMAKASLGQLAWIVVALMAVGNAGGRIIAGMVSDKIGRARTLVIVMTFQAIVIASLIFIDESQGFLLVIAATLIGFNYGTNLSLFPSATKTYFGLKNFGVNYGLVFSAWGVGGFIFPRVSQMIIAATGSPDTAYIMASFLLFLAAGMALITRAPRSIRERAKVITVMEPGKVYSGHFIYQPVFMPVLNAEGQTTDDQNQEEPKITSLSERKLAKA